MRRIALAILSTAATLAHAQPTESPVKALDGDARNLEVQPQAAYRDGRSIVRGLRRALSATVRAFLLPYRFAVQLEGRYKLLSKLRILVNEEETLGLVPTVAFQSAFGVNLGARAFVANHFGLDELITVSANRGGSVVQAHELNASLPHLGVTPIYVRAVVRYEDNNNQFFAGIGNSGPQVGTRYSQARFLATLSTGVELRPRGRYLRFGLSGIFNERSFGAAGGDSSDPSIEEIYDTSTLRGFDDGFANLEITGDFELDTRDHQGVTQRGGVLRGFAGGGSPVGDARYLHYGAEASYFVSPFWPRRTFVGRIALEGVLDRDDDIPFTELPRLGGVGTLRGYPSGRFRDKYSTVATLEYRWPVHELVTGELFVEAAKIGRTYDELVSAEDWHFGYGGGVIIHTTDRIRLRVDIAYGEALELYFTTDVLAAFRAREREL